MANVHPILSDLSAGISELKKDPMGVIKAGHGDAVAIINRNEPVFYAVPAKLYEALLDIADDIALAKIVEERQGQKEIQVNIDDL